MSSSLPLPLVSADVDLVDFAFMRLDVRRLRDSRIASLVSGEEFRSAVLLWCASWHQRPAASLPDDDVELSQLAGFGRATSEWKKVREGALHGWIKCTDGRLYHPVVAEKAIEAWAEKLEFRWRRECDRVRKANKSREKEGQPPLELPPHPKEGALISIRKAEISGGKPEAVNGSMEPSAGNDPPSNGIPAENALKGNGRGNGRGKIDYAGPPLRDGMTDDQPPPEPAEVIPTQQAELFRRGKDILGKSAGGLIRNLLTAKDDNVALARAAIETASTRENPREYLGAIIAGRERNSAQQTARDRGDAW